MFMEFQIANAIHAEREVARNRVVEGMTVQAPSILNRFMRAVRGSSRKPSADHASSQKLLKPLSQGNAIAR